VLSGRGLCDELITRPEESYRLWCVVVCDLENLKNEEATTHVGSQRHNKKVSNSYDDETSKCLTLPSSSLSFGVFTLVVLIGHTFIYILLYFSLT